jgi:threonine-phosphate decarboxylase
MKQAGSEFQHGGDIYTEGILVGRELLDFSSNINPLGIPNSFLEHLEEGIKAVTRYPDIEYRQLKSTICSYINKPYIGAENLLLGNGAAEIIDLAIGAFRSILLIVPSFSEYENSTAKAKVEIAYSYLKSDMSIDYEDLYTKLKEGYIEALVIANPNNPNGAVIDKARFKLLMELCSSKHITIIIDEAFIEFAGSSSSSFIEDVEFYENIFIIRALTKFFALPGIRFGYGLSRNQNLVKSIKERQNPWNINCFAETAANYVLKDYEYIGKSLQWIAEELPYLTEQLKKLGMIEQVYESSCNFILCKLKGITDAELYDYCMSKGVAIRRASNFKGLNSSFVRFAVKDRKSNERLIKILRDR